MSNQTFAKGIFKSEGSMLKQEGTVLSTKTIRFGETPVRQSKIEKKETTTVAVGGWFDPLAQTFMVEESGGCFVTQIDLFFQKKDATLPVNVQIREVVNGYPGSIVLPYSECSRTPAEVNVPEPPDSTVATSFILDGPVYLQEKTEYCFVVYSDSFEYNVWIAEIGGKDLVTGEIISKQPYNGVLFKSQNASTWTANQDQDMKFVIYKAQFNITSGSGTVVLENDVIPSITLPLNPIETFSGSTRIRVHNKNHGFTGPIGASTTSKVTLSGFEPSTPYNGIPGSALNGTFDITSAQMDSYTFTCSVAATELTGSGRTGGDSVVSSKNINMDVMRPNIAELTFPKTELVWDAKTTSGKSLNGTEVPYDITSAYSPISIIDNNNMLVPKVVASPDNFTGPSLKIRGTLSSTNKNISPIVDTNRLSAILVSNKIDYPMFSERSVWLASTDTSDLLTVTLTDHGLSDTAVVTLAPFDDLGAFTQEAMTGEFHITRIDDDQFTVKMPVVQTPIDVTRIDDTDKCTICISDYKYVPETDKSSGTCSAKYITSKFTFTDPAVSAKLMFSASIEDNTAIEIYYKKQGPYDTNPFKDLPYVALGEPDSFVPLSSTQDDFRDYEFTTEFPDGEEFINIAFKIVMKSTNRSRVPIFNDFRVIALGT